MRDLLRSEVIGNALNIRSLAIAHGIDRGHGVRLTSSDRHFHQLIVGTELRHLKKASMPMSALGQKQTSRAAISMSGLPPKADIVQHGGNVRFVPKAEVSDSRSR